MPSEVFCCEDMLFCIVRNCYLLELVSYLRYIWHVQITQVIVVVVVVQSCLDLCDPMDCCRHSILETPWDSPGKYLGVGCQDLQKIFPAQGSTLPLLPPLHWQLSSLARGSPYLPCLSSWISLLGNLTVSSTLVRTSLIYTTSVVFKLWVFTIAYSTLDR